MKKVKATKAHVRTVDLLMQDTCGVKRGSLLRYVFSSFKSYNLYVMRKFSSLPEEKKKDMERLRKKIAARNTRLRQVVANANSKARMGVMN